MEYYIVQDGTQFGPLERGQVAAALRGGQFAGTDLYWHDGMAEWKPLADSTVAVEAAASDEEAAPPGIAVQAACALLAAALLGAGGWLAAGGAVTLGTAWIAAAWPTAPATITASDADGGRLHVSYKYMADDEPCASARAMPEDAFLMPFQARAWAAAHPAGSAATAHYKASARDTAFLEAGAGRRTGAELASGVALLWAGLGAAAAAWLLPKYGVRRNGRFRLQRGSHPARFLPAWGTALAALAGAAAWMAL